MLHTDYMQKIVITGGLGYIGGELCKLYSGETRYKNIVVVDNKFLASQVKQITDWGMTYVQASILDEPVISKLVTDADIVYHFAGVTDVPHTKSESNDEKNKQIEDTAIRGTNIILNSVSDKCKLIFPSTHVVFEGLTETKFDVDETQTPSPTLSYAKCKYKNELDIQASNKNYLILRLSSVYGLSGDTMRINIMPNLFSKFAALGLPIKMFSGGIQYKSLVSVKDVARSFKYLAESNYSREVFHISNDNVTVKQVAEICKKYKPSLQLLSTNDEIPNLGYTLSNKKLLSTGFKFLYTLDESIKEMIESWSVKTPTDLEYVITGSKEFVDDRGKISNYELPEPINLIGYIESKAGSVRANHYHPIQEQKCLLIKGSYISVIKDLSDSKAPIQTQIIKAGDVSVIQPNVAHTMVFLEDSIFLNLVRGEREHENYGVTHTIPYKLVDDKFKNELLQNYATKCRSSDSKNLKPVVSLGLSPLANNLLNSPDQPDELYPLEMTYCPDSHNCQLSYVVPENKMFDNYLYVSSTTKTFRDHFEKAASDYVTKFKLNQNSFVVDIGSNDGIALKPLKAVGVKVLGVEPAKNIAEIANNNDITTINNYFVESVANEILTKYGKVDVVTASNVFAHSDKLKEIANNVFKILNEDGTFIIEVQYLLDTIKDLTFDNIYHEHVNYWSVTSLNYFFRNLGLYITDVEHINTHGGSIRVYVNRNNKNVTQTVDKFLSDEEQFGLKNYDTYLKFAKRVEKAKQNVVANVKKLKNKGYTLVGYGSPAKATTSLNYYGINHTDIDYIVEDNSLKHNKLIPGVRIPIYSKQKLTEKRPDVIIVMAWNFVEEIKKNNQDLIQAGVRFVSIKDLQDETVVDKLI